MRKLLNTINLFILLRIIKVNPEFINPLNWKVPNPYELIFISFPVKPNIIYFKYDRNGNEINRSSYEFNLIFIYNNRQIISSPNNNLTFNENYWYNPKRHYKSIEEATWDYIEDRRLFGDQHVVKENNFYVFKDQSKVKNLHGKYVTWFLIKAIHYKTKELLTLAKQDRG